MDYSATLIDSSIFIILITVSLISIFAFIYRNSITSLIDPLLLNGILVCIYLSGLLGFLNIQNQVAHSTKWVVAGIFIAFLVPSVFVRHVNIKQGTASTSTRITSIFFYAIIGLMIINLIANYVFGVIPLLSGTQSRGMQGTSLIPTLVLISPQLGIIGICMLAFSNENKFPGKLCVILFICTMILSGSKSAVIQLLLVFLFYLYLRRFKCTSINTKTSYKFPKFKIGITILFCLAVAPIYFSIVVESNVNTDFFSIFIYRLLAGFDIVFHMANNNIDASLVNSANIFDFYLYPILKLVGFTPNFQSAGQYVSAEVFGYSDLFESLNPNSNLVVEWIMSFGNISGIIGSIFCTTAVFNLRKKLLNKRKIRILDMFLMPQFILGPFGILLDGSLFMISLIWTLVIYFFINTFANILNKSIKSHGRYLLY